MYDKRIKGPIADKFNPWHYPSPALWKNAKEEDLSWPASPELALYIHIPFCEERCSYCHFTAYAKRKQTHIDQYFKNLKKEISLYDQKPFVKNSQVKSIYFGGGTPSLVKSSLLFDLMEHLKSNFNFAPGYEFSFEANPSTLTDEKLESLKIVGVNRLSIGIQSFSDSVLQAMNRKHSAKDAIDKVRKAKEKGFKNINIDLIYGYPGQTIESWNHSLDAALSLDSGRITCTALTVWPKTTIYQKLKGGEVPKIKESFDAELFNLAFDKILATGYKPFSALSFSRNEENIWRQQQDVLSGKMPILGLGLSAISYNSRFGYLNTKSLPDYERMAQTGYLPIVKAQKVNRKLSRCLRIIQSIKILSISKEDYKEEIGTPVSKIYGRKMRKLMNRGLLKEDDEAFRLTKKGILYMGFVSRNFYLPLDRYKINQFFAKHYFPLVEQ